MSFLLFINSFGNSWHHIGASSSLEIFNLLVGHFADIGIIVLTFHKEGVLNQIVVRICVSNISLSTLHDSLIRLILMVTCIVDVYMGCLSGVEAAIVNIMSFVKVLKIFKLTWQVLIGCLKLEIVLEVPLGCLLLYVIRYQAMHIQSFFSVVILLFTDQGLL